MGSNFANFTKNINSSIQFSYPSINNIILTGNSFFIPNNSTTPSFSLTDGTNNKYISGTAVKGYIGNNNIMSNPELVIEHMSANTGTKFYVVIPLAKDNKTKSTLSRLNNKSSVTLDLNSDIPLKNTVYHYTDSGENTHVFVFKTPITVKDNFSSGASVSSLPSLDSKTSKQTYIVNSNTKVEDEVVCGSIEPETVKSKSNEDVKMTTVVYALGMFLSCIVIIAISVQLLSTMNADSQFWFAVGCIPFFFIFIVALLLFYKTNIQYTIVSGSLAATMVVICIMALFPNWFKLSKQLAVATNSAKAASLTSIENPAFKFLKNK